MKRLEEAEALQAQQNAAIVSWTPPHPVIGTNITSTHSGVVSHCLVQSDDDDDEVEEDDEGEEREEDVNSRESDDGLLDLGQLEDSAMEESH